MDERCDGGARKQERIVMFNGLAAASRRLQCPARYRLNVAG
jgi:hypothetical protein